MQVPLFPSPVMTARRLRGIAMCLRLSALWLVWTVGISPAVMAQQSRERADPALAARCQAAASRLASAATEPGQELAQMSRCDETGPQVLARLWEDASVDPARVDGLVYLTSSLHDQRVLDALLRVATSLTRDRMVRLRALGVLITYIDPKLVVRLGDLDSVTPEPVLGWRGHLTHGVGSEAPGADAPDRIMDALRAMGTSDSDPIAPSAKWLWEALVRERPTLGLPDAERLSLTVVCGMRFVIVNPNPIRLLVKLVMPGLGSYSPQLPASDSTTVEFARPAPVTLQYAGDVIARASPSSEPCR